MKWKAMSRNDINNRVDEALADNASYAKGEVMGTPATYLDQEEFYPDASFLDDAPFLRTLIANPNHIGCHTINKNSSPIFKGTHTIERELIDICALEIFKGKKNEVDGYVATGGTEANIQALWIYRNYFKQEYRANNQEIGVIFSEDTHYSITKGCDLLSLNPLMVAVKEENRQIDIKQLETIVQQAKKTGMQYFIVVLNVSTTMFGSVDDIRPITDLLDHYKMVYKVHLDAAFGGFIYPFSNPESIHNFTNPAISSITIDGHKMLQTPYGTGIFLIRKGFMKYVNNEYAQYVPGLDYTLCGSRSGANAVVIWMLLMNYGAEGWKSKMEKLIERTDYLCAELDHRSIEYYRNPYLNIVSIKANQIEETVARKFELVADTYEGKVNWWKIVVMDHVSMELLKQFLSELKVKHACWLKELIH